VTGRSPLRAPGDPRRATSHPADNQGGMGHGRGRAPSRRTPVDNCRQPSPRSTDAHRESTRASSPGLSWSRIGTALPMPSRVISLPTESGSTQQLTSMGSSQTSNTLEPDPAGLSASRDRINRSRQQPEEHSFGRLPAEPLSRDPAARGRRHPDWSQQYWVPLQTRRPLRSLTVGGLGALVWMVVAHQPSPADRPRERRRTSVG
jgi:hypothetical protein